MKKCELKNCHNYKENETNNCTMYYNVDNCAYQKDFECPVKKEVKRMKDYEAYNVMHIADGIIGRSLSSSKL